MTGRSAAWLLGSGVVIALAGCGERVQTMPTGPALKADHQEWQITDNGYLAPGWKPGDKASWEAHLKVRTQMQNDYAPR